MEKTRTSPVNRLAMRKAFTLIELVVVMVLLALLASLTVYSLGGTMDRYRVSRAIETVELFDARARRAARTTRRGVNVTIDRKSRELLIDPIDPQQENASFQLPSKVEIEEVRFAGSKRSQKQSDFSISGQGRSTTYAIQLRRGELTRWLVVLGFSGQVVPVNNESEVDAILSI